MIHMSISQYDTISYAVLVGGVLEKLHLLVNINSKDLYLYTSSETWKTNNVEQPDKQSSN
jgi:hypothetical protein